MVLCKVANRAGESCAALRSISRDAKCIGMGRMGKNYGRMKKCSITEFGWTRQENVWLKVMTGGPIIISCHDGSS